MYDNEYYSLVLHDGVCDSTKKIDTLTGKMNEMEDNWVLSSSGRHMFIRFIVGSKNPYPGFYANIHYGIKFKMFFVDKVSSSSITSSSLYNCNPFFS